MTTPDAGTGNELRALNAVCHGADELTEMHERYCVPFAAFFEAEVAKARREALTEAANMLQTEAKLIASFCHDKTAAVAMCALLLNMIARDEPIPPYARAAGDPR